MCIRDRANAEDGTKVHNQHDGNSRQNTGKRDMPNHLHPACTVNGGGLIKSLVDTGDCGQIDDRVPPHRLPNLRDYINGFKILWLSQKVDGFASKQLDKIVDHTINFFKFSSIKECISSRISLFICNIDFSIVSFKLSE